MTMLMTVDDNDPGNVDVDVDGSVLASGVLSRVLSFTPLIAPAVAMQIMSIRGEGG